MTATSRVLAQFTLLTTLAFGTASVAASTIVLDVPGLATAGTARGFQFVSFQFDLYLVPVGDPVSDYAANVLANDRENYTYEHPVACGSGRGGGYCPPKYARGPANTYSDTYQHVTSPPGTLDAFFHFSGADAAGLPLEVTVSQSGPNSMVLTADGDPTPIVPGTPLRDTLYTLEYRTGSLAGVEIIFARAVPEPAAVQLTLVGLALVTLIRRWTRAA